MPGTPESPDRIYLGKLKLAVDVLLRASEETDLVNDALESELVLAREKVEHALLLAPDNQHSA